MVCLCLVVALPLSYPPLPRGTSSPGLFSEVGWVRPFGGGDITVPTLTTPAWYSRQSARGTDWMNRMTESPHRRGSYPFVRRTWAWTACRSLGGGGRGDGERNTLSLNFFVFSLLLGPGSIETRLSTHPSIHTLSRPAVLRSTQSILWRLSSSMSQPGSAVYDWLVSKFLNL